MKKYVLVIVGICLCVFTNAQNAKEFNSMLVADTPRYKLYPTNNMWTFIKLDTKKGDMTHVQFSVGDGDSFEYPLGSPYSYYSDTYSSLIENGRFTLYSTQNTYNFILLDQLSGRTWQVQWNHDKNKRMVAPIN